MKLHHFFLIFAVFSIFLLQPHDASAAKKEAKNPKESYITITKTSFDGEIEYGKPQKISWKTNLNKKDFKDGYYIALSNNLVPDHMFGITLATTSSKSKKAVFTIESHHVQSIINGNKNPEISEEDIRNNFFVKVYASKKTIYKNQYSTINGRAQTVSIMSGFGVEKPSLKLDIPEDMRMYTPYDIAIERTGDHANVSVWVTVKNNLVDTNYRIPGFTSDQDTFVFYPANTATLFISRKPAAVTELDVLKNFYFELTLLDNGVEFDRIKTENFTIVK